jgi:hypothetical protein
MTTMQTYHGVVHAGHIQLEPGVDLPEGSQVYVIVAGQEPIVEERMAQRKANRWLVEYVGNLLAAAEGRLIEADGRILWRFGAFITGRGHRPRGPIGYVDVDAHSGKVLATEHQANEMIAHGEAFARSLLSPE